jgi:hypothetical protein
MARAKPARSPYAATRHLLKYAGDPRQLRRNPLTRVDFAGRSLNEALCRIAVRVDAALDAIDTARHLAILVRVDLERHDPRRVATDLGLSTRQFYRERRLAHDAFHAAYLSASRTAISVESDLAQRLSWRATSLADSGETESATALFEDLLASGGDSAVACDALWRLATLEAWSHRFDGARSHLDACREILERETVQEDRRASLADGLAAAMLTLRWFTRGPAAVAPGRDGERLPESERTTLTRASAALRSGESSQALGLIRKLLNRPRTVGAPDVEFDLLALQAEVANFAFSDPSRGEELFSRAATLASVHGLRGRELYARHQLFVARWMHSRRAEDRRAYRQLFDAVDRSLPVRLRSSLALVAADVEVAIGTPQRALAAAATAASLSTNGFELVSSRGLAAAALLRMGRLNDAVLEAGLATRAARAQGHARVLSLTQRICAQAHFAQGDRHAARSAIEESIECAMRFSSPYVQAQTQVLWERIAGRKTLATVKA